MINKRKIMIKQDVAFTKPLLLTMYNPHSQQLPSQTKQRKN